MTAPVEEFGSGFEAQPEAVLEGAGTPIAGRSLGQIAWMRLKRDKVAIGGGVVVILLILMAIFAPLIADPEAATRQVLEDRLQPASWLHLFGTDELGRDVLSRLIYGARISTGAAILPVLLALIVGIPLGLIAGYFRGFWDEWIITRVVDALQAFPFLILALALAAVMGSGFFNAMIAIGIGFIPGFLRIVRGQVLTVSTEEYIQSAKALGVGDFRILWVHILPNSMAPVLVQTSVAMAAGILAEAGLSFLGVGVAPPTPSWGEMLTTAQTQILTNQWLAVPPGIAIFLAVLGFNLLGDGLRDALDPRLRL
jgi:ABC-type dipeptide/oligopeptide/nickel transport system permease subunit